MDGGCVLIRRQLPDGNTRRLDFGSDLFGPLAVSTMNDDRASLFREHACDTFPDPAAAARNKGAPSRKFEIHSTAPQLQMCISLLSDHTRGWGAYPHLGMAPANLLE
jgi:hypothetical protein